jgi:hypothetical protein
VRMRLRTGVVLLTLSALLPVAAGCGELGGDTRPERRTPVVNESDVDRYEAGTPAHAFLAWFRALQRGDYPTLRGLYVDSLGLSEATLQRQRQAGAYAIDPLALPVIESVDVNGDSALVRARFRTGRIWPNGRIDYTNKEIVPFQLRREGGHWLLADNDFLELVAREPAAPAPKPARLPIVSGRQLSRYAPGSPGRSLLEWFRALERRDARTAARYYVPALGISVPELAKLRREAEAFDLLGPPIVVKVATRGNVAVVTVRNRTIRDSSKPEQGFVISAPTPFELHKVDGRWLFPGNGFLQVLARLPADEATP